MNPRSLAIQSRAPVCHAIHIAHGRRVASGVLTSRRIARSICRGLGEGGIGQAASVRDPSRSKPTKRFHALGDRGKLGVARFAVRSTTSSID
jgi:hypothetical protein